MLGSWAGAMGNASSCPGITSSMRSILTGTESATFGLRKRMPCFYCQFFTSVGLERRPYLGPARLATTKFDISLADGKTGRPLQEWNALGIRRLNGTNLPQKALDARLLRPARAGGSAFLMYENFDVLMKWNRSHYFVISVGTLSDKLRP